MLGGRAVTLFVILIFYFSLLFLVRRTRGDGLAVELHVGVLKTRVEFI